MIFIILLFLFAFNFTKDKHAIKNLLAMQYLQFKNEIYYYPFIIIIS